MPKCGYCGEESIERFCSQEHEENSAVFNIMENLTEELDLVYKATSYPWKVNLTENSYNTLKERPGTCWVPELREYLRRPLIYKKGGHEYLICVENLNIPFIIHARISSKEADIDELVLDDLDRPNIQKEYQADWDAYEP